MNICDHPLEDGVPPPRQKRCYFCGRFYCPDVRARDRQKSCSRPGCRKRRKRQAQEEWVKANPDGFQGRYGNTQEWLKVHPGYLKGWRARRRDIQDKIRPETPVKSIRLVVPAFFRGDIQDEIRLVRRCGCGSYVTGKGVLRVDIQDKIASSAPFP